MTFLLLLLLRLVLLGGGGDRGLHLLDGGQAVRQDAGRQFAVERVVVVTLPGRAVVECKYCTVNKNGPAHPATNPMPTDLQCKLTELRLQLPMLYW